MYEPLKNTIARIEASYPPEYIYSLNDRGRIIADFGRNVSLVIKQLNEYEPIVRLVTERHLDAAIVSRTNLNLTLIMQELCESAAQYFYVTAVYLMDGFYEQNLSLWTSFSEARHKMTQLFADMQASNFYGVDQPEAAEVLRRANCGSDGSDTRRPTAAATGMLRLNLDEVARMNGAELTVCMQRLFEILEYRLQQVSNGARNHRDQDMQQIYDFNLLVYYKHYWPAHIDHFRAHIANHRLGGKVDIDRLEQLKRESTSHFEHHSPSGRIWRDNAKDEAQMAMQMKDYYCGKDGEKQWQCYFEFIFEDAELDRWIEELSQPPEAEADAAKRERLLRSNTVFCVAAGKNGQQVDMLRLYRFIEARLVSRMQFVYEWYALYHLLLRKGILSGCTVELFVRQMNHREWFAHAAKKCSANEINTYSFLNDKSAEAWDLRYKPAGTNKASLKAIRNLYLTYSDLADAVSEIYVKR